MPTQKNHRKGGHEKNRRGLLSGKASSFHGRSGAIVEEMLRRPRTVPELLAGKKVAANTSDLMVVRERPKLTKLLLKVTIQRSLGAVQVLLPPEATVEDLIAAALKQYVKEGRRTSTLPSTDPSDFDLHYSQFSLESLDREEKLMVLGSRNFFLCPKTVAAPAEGNGGAMASASTSSCSKEAATSPTIIGLPWLNLMDLFL